MSIKPRILFWDVETSYLTARIWRPGKQYVGHSQLVPGSDKYNIICLAYCWNDGKPAKALDWGVKTQDSGNLVEEFDRIVKTADIVIGKNSDAFDNKHLNTQRLLHGMDGMPDWTKYTDDLQKQLKKHFYLPSHSLDYVSKMLGLGGKVKMEMDDWVQIIEHKNAKVLKKMVTYCKKDVEDTRAIWNTIEKHIEPKFKANVHSLDPNRACTNCGSHDIIKNGFRFSGQVKYQTFTCKKHGGYAGRAAVKKDGSLGKIQ